MDLATLRATILRNAMNRSEHWVYRGHASVDWLLESSYSRFYKRVFGAQRPFSLDRFEGMLDRFIRQASTCLEEPVESCKQLDYMAVAQHHGLPTPLLDWSHSPYVAIYFAVSEPNDLAVRDVTFRLFGLNVAGLALPNSPEEVKARVAVAGSPPYCFIDTSTFISRRISRQFGCFTFHNFCGALDQFESQRIRVYDVTADRWGLLNELALMGINGGALFDDLDYVSRDIIQSEVLNCLQ